MAMHEKMIAHHSIQLRNDTSECSRLYAFLSDNIADLPVTEEQHHDLKLAAEEILSNIIRHGYDSSTEATIILEFIVTENSISLVFSDTGRAFNPLDASSMSAGDDLSQGGMGIQLVKSLTDDQSYERKDNTNVFTVTKHYN
jgi:serine/threonine-protein kinase RsbW